MAHLRADQFYLHAGAGYAINDLAQARVFDDYAGDPDILSQFDGGTYNIVCHPEKTSPINAKSAYNNILNRFDEPNYTKSWVGRHLNTYPTAKCAIGCSTTFGDKSYWALGPGNTLLGPSATPINNSWSRPALGSNNSLQEEIRRRLMLYTTAGTTSPYGGAASLEEQVKDLYRTIFKRFHPNRFIIVLNWEFAGGWFSWSPRVTTADAAVTTAFNTYKSNLHATPTTGQYGNSAEYIDAWQAVVTWIREVQQENLGAGQYSYTKPPAGGSHCKIAMIGTSNDGTVGWFVDAYPGDGYVDILGADQYLRLDKTPSRTWSWIETRLNNQWNFAVGRGKQYGWHEIGVAPAHPTNSTSGDYATGKVAIKDYLSYFASWLYSRPTTGPGSLGYVGWWSAYGSDANAKIPIGYYNWASCPSAPVVASYVKSAQDEIKDHFIQLFLKGNTGLFLGTYSDDNTPVDVNVGPIVDAGTDQNLDTGTTSTTLTSSASDDGLPATPGALSYSWEMLEGPNTPTIVSPTASSTSVTGMTDGIYQFRVTVTDGELSSRDIIQVIIGTSEPDTDPTPDTDTGGGNDIVIEPIGFGPPVIIAKSLDTGRRLRCGFDSDIDQEGGYLAHTRRPY